MLYAKNKLDDKTRAVPKARATCPYCDAEVIAKCGEINIWHWAHVALAQCDHWSEGESDWHLLWKSIIPPAQVEVTIEKDNKRHRADIVTKDGIVVELQHSYIAPDEIREREQFYKHMVWLFDIRSVANNFTFRKKRQKYYRTFRWLWPRKHIAYTSTTTYLDLGDGKVFCLGKLYPSGGGWGHVYDYQQFISRLLKERGNDQI